MITDDTLASLRANDIRLDNLFLYLDDYSLPNGEDNGDNDEDDDDTLVAALSGNTHVTAVDCDMHLDTMTDALGKLMTGIGRLVNLQRLRCSSSGDYAVTMAAMAKALYETTTTRTTTATSSKLVSLDLANFLLQDASTCEPESLAKTSYQEFVTALQGHATLQNFNLGFGYSSSSNTTTTTTTLLETESETNACFSLTPLLQALATAPNLQWVRLDGAGFASPQALTPKGLGAILTSTSISTLEVHDFDLSRHHVEAVGQALVTNTSLKVLSLSCHTYTHFGPDEDNASHHHPTPSCACSNLSFALCTNTTLEKIYLPHQMLLLDTTNNSSNQQHVDAPLIAFLQALKVNSSLRQVHVTGASDTLSLSCISQPAEDAFRRMLHHNYTLEAIHMPWFTSDEWQAKIQLYIKLNQLGRGRLVRGGGGRDGGAATMATSPLGSAALPHQWIEVLGQVQDDVSCLFHLLLLNPLLCDENHHSFLQQ